MCAAILYVVATPIGNLEDITLRALRVLKEVDFILSEDTRETSKVLKRFDIEKPQISYRDQNHTKVIDRVLDILISGASLALVTDSGTPLVSDPGYKLVKTVIEKGFPVTAIPGPAAFVPALVASGLPTDKFTFLGFLPKSKVQQGKLLKQVGQLDGTIVIYESPYRINKLLGQIHASLGNRHVVLARELTKLHEEYIRGACGDLLTEYVNKKWKGEFVVLIAKESFKGFSSSAVGRKDAPKIYE
jgi:16S rRNA (cytidine1402-2'-O)-methyltransferase